MGGRRRSATRHPLTRLLSLLLLLPFLALPVKAQSHPLGVELRAYPAGLIPAARGDWPVGPRLSFTALAGYNFTNRRNWGEHSHESGGGPGLGVGLSRSVPGARTGWLLGFRTEFWTLGINWRDPGGRRGNTRVWVFQPTARVGHIWGWTGSRLQLEATASLGAEINVRTRGEAVGKGPIFLLGVGLLGLP